MTAMMSEIGIALTDKAVGTLWGAALGDALGWPHEERARKVRDAGGIALAPWVKRSGGRFNPHEEAIEAGGYSDDTQLILAVSRARLSGTKWARNLATVELPFWPIYERGGGGATLRAARLLQKSTLPWDAPPVDREKYFAAGGNGVAMRIAPHVVFGAPRGNFEAIAEAVMADGVLTHGHPRALVGALVYAYALWRALLSESTLRYGQLLDEVSSDISAWARIPDISMHWPSWRLALSQHPGSFLDLWDDTIGEVRDALEIARSGLKTGALALDEETLAQLGCFDRKRNGAGTVTAIASIFLASKHAVSPFEGVARAALAKGADTDTLASMTGALAGAVSGSDWLRGYYAKIQDARYIADIAQQLVSNHPRTRVDVHPMRVRDLEHFFDHLPNHSTVTMPFGDEAKVTRHQGLSSLSPNLHIESWRLETRVGQTLFVKRLRKSVTEKGGHGLVVQSSPKTVAVAVFAGVTLWVRSISSAKNLYCEALGLVPTRESDTTLQFGDHLALRQKANSTSFGNGSVIYLRVSDIDLCFSKVARVDGSKASEITERSGRKAFKCIDNDGHVLEVFEG